jgi:hypothetical protein
MIGRDQQFTNFCLQPKSYCVNLEKSSCELRDCKRKGASEHTAFGNNSLKEMCDWQTLLISLGVQELET